MRHSSPRPAAEQGQTTALDARINCFDPNSLALWAGRFGIPPHELVAAVSKTGARVGDVAHCLLIVPDTDQKQ
ncbi:DUF3606 domain-containing protein [Muricoccus radiodurans]|uniref:DUF3606 domain-containing protein n=1 Tax=Muricoccus radiodurans TaxID=2231721 RepID=UPI003CF1CF86